MKTKEEIEQLANDYWEGCDGCDANDKYFFIKGFGSAYRQLQEDMDKKYTEDDIKETAYFFVSKKLAANQGILDEEIQDFIQSLNKQD